MNATRRRFVGLTITRLIYGRMSVIIMPHVEPVVNDLAPENESRPDVRDEEARSRATAPAAAGFLDTIPERTPFPVSHVLIHHTA